MDDGINAFEVRADHVVPLLLGHFFDGEILEIPNTGVGHENVQAAQPRDRVVDETLVLGVPADIGFKGLHARAVFPSFLLNLDGSILGFEVTKNHVGAGLRKHFDRRGADAARAAGDERRFACERNHDTPDWNAKSELGN